MLIRIVDNPQSTIYNHQYMKGEEEKKMEALITRDIRDFNHGSIRALVTEIQSI